MTAVKLSYLTEEEQVIVVETDKQINKGERGKTIYATARV